MQGLRFLGRRAGSCSESGWRRRARNSASVYRLSPPKSTRAGPPAARARRRRRIPTTRNAQDRATADDSHGHVTQPQERRRESMRGRQLVPREATTMPAGCARRGCVDGHPCALFSPASPHGIGRKKCTAKDLTNQRVTIGAQKSTEILWINLWVNCVSVVNTRQFYTQEKSSLLGF